MDLQEGAYLRAERTSERLPQIDDRPVFKVMFEGSLTTTRFLWPPYEINMEGHAACAFGTIVQWLVEYEVPQNRLDFCQATLYTYIYILY